MKSLFPLLSVALLVATLFTNCKNSSTPATETTTVDSTATYEPVVEGYWVNKAWWETLQSTKSPHKAAEKLGVAAVVVSKDSTGAWQGVVNYAFHEGMAYKLVPVEGGNFHLMNPDGQDKAHEFLFNADSTVFLDSAQMVRIGDGQMDDTDLFVGIINGTYTLKGKGEVNFASNGSVSGLEGYQGYDILFDYIEDQLGADEVMLIKANDERDFYVFENKGNQLLLYGIDEITHKDGSTQYKKGKVKYELTKQ